MRVKGDTRAGIPRLAEGVLRRAHSHLETSMDAVGVASVSNAVKALALANAFAARGAPAGEAADGVAFLPAMAVRTMEDGDGSNDGTKLLRLSVMRWSVAAPENVDFSHGGIYVPVDGEASGRGGRAAAASDSASGSVNASGKGKGEHGVTAPARQQARVMAQTVSTPTALAEVVLGHWLRFVSPELHHAVRAAAARHAAGREDVAVVATDKTVKGRQRPPFLCTMGPLALGRAVKALAFAHGDLCKEDRLRGVPPFVVVPRFWENRRVDRYTGKERTSKLVILCLAQPAPTLAGKCGRA